MPGTKSVYRGNQARLKSIGLEHGVRPSGRRWRRQVSCKAYAAVLRGGHAALRGEAALPVGRLGRGFEPSARVVVELGRVGRHVFANDVDRVLRAGVEFRGIA